MSQVRNDLKPKARLHFSSEKLVYKANTHGISKRRKRHSTFCDFREGRLNKTAQARFKSAKILLANRSPFAKYLKDF